MGISFNDKLDAVLNRLPLELQSQYRVELENAIDDYGYEMRSEGYSDGESDAWRAASYE